ncbi:MAG: hypothetical protein MZU95_15775 [Desulfomicrobium escambiense]|nr:hypothetical protein [Desulfomicrobium escambiense]
MLEGTAAADAVQAAAGLDLVRGRLEHLSTAADDQSPEALSLVGQGADPLRDGTGYEDRLAFQEGQPVPPDGEFLNAKLDGLPGAHTEDRETRPAGGVAMRGPSLTSRPSGPMFSRQMSTETASSSDDSTALPGRAGGSPPCGGTGRPHRRDLPGGRAPFPRTFPAGNCLPVPPPGCPRLRGQPCPLPDQGRNGLVARPCPGWRAAGSCRTAWTSGLLAEAAEERPRGPVIGYGLAPGVLSERRLPAASS